MAKVLQGQKKPEDLVQPIIQFENEKEHALKTLFREDKAPVLTSIGYCAVPGVSGYGRWISYVIKSQGEKIISVEVGYPNLKQVVEDEANIAFMSQMGRDDD